MIEIEKFNDFSDKTDEGKLLLAAISILTSISEEDIKSNKWGGMITPDTAFKQIKDLANMIYYIDEWRSYKISSERNIKIKDILDDKLSGIKSKEL